MALPSSPLPDGDCRGGSENLFKEIFDGDDLLDRRLEESLAHLCPKARAAVQKRRRCAEEIVVCELLLRQWQVKHGMEVDPTRLSEEELSDRRRIALCHAAALEGVANRRREGIDVLRLCLGGERECFTTEHEERDEFPPEEHLDVAVALALAKLYFKDNRKERALAWCDAILRKLRSDAGCCSMEDVSDAYHLAGWIRIHADDHTGAYQLWTEGHEAVPDCDALARQYRKRACWDNRNDEEVTNPCLLGEGAHGDGVFQRNEDLEAFAMPEENTKEAPALSLFNPETQKNELVFRTRHPVLTPQECKLVLEEVHSFHNKFRKGKWGTVRHSSVKTTDVAVEDIPTLRPWLRDLLRTRLFPLVAAAYPQLADGSTPGDMGDRMRVHDAFIVRYDAENDGSFSLPEHSDTSAVSFTVALNSRSDTKGNHDEYGAVFEGGGTWFEALGDSHKSGKVVDADVGHAVAFAGPLRHAGFPVTKGCRVILVLFLYIDGFSYGTYVQEHSKQHGISNTCEEVDGKKKNTTNELDSVHERKARPSGDMPGGFVVYNQ
eukprot:CAMPEP_0172546906 /NCGR_PEP_ID=MMETSP1067-20121228/16568_1 /TAXON_ID=265564 ORGANISM="Thalassiosira punctigera, Strain Tpunct2005C2" /NCGR_SAMPLE_ID=MMETSP1067 /ASSEMBLY_ACC=CAM_ASM_000444 /LENGTH=548 /DNA_ID=CAMNT_0013333905 /DNA_START=75 /DNA_END=1718 /DNA_ORIENTATION=+